MGHGSPPGTIVRKGKCRLGKPVAGMLMVVTCPQISKAPFSQLEALCHLLGGGAHCLLLPGNVSGVRVPTPSSLSLHVERRENRSTLLNEAKGEHARWQSLSCILSFQLTIILTSTFQKNQLRLEEGNWLGLAASKRTMERRC